MKTIKYRTIDKSSWARGAWDDEPDKIQWEDKKTGLPCLIVRNAAGALCGYVGIPKEHPYFEKDYDDLDVQVHGGLTFADFCQPDAETHGICHTVEPGENDRVWWLGFDCAHSGDTCPGYTQYRSAEHPGLFELKDYDTYRAVPYVKRQCAKLAAQLVEVKA
jgi:hypothetical protein